MRVLRKPQKNAAVEQQMQKLERDMDNIELMDKWGREDSVRAREESDRIAKLRRDKR